jgi:exosortase family protein XrtF
MNRVVKLVKEFKPALRFLGVFLACYVAMSLAYGFFIESYGDQVDPWTRNVSQQVAFFLSGPDNPVVAIDSYRTRSCSLASNNGEVLSVFEGCNGLNVMILFISFLIAYRGPLRKFLMFSVIGLLIIHVVNLGRVAMLYLVAQYYPNYMYFTHKYLFTAVIYAIVFGLWYIWVSKYNANPKLTKVATNT